MAHAFGSQIPIFPDEYPNIPTGRKRRTHKLTPRAFRQSFRAIISLAFPIGSLVTMKDIRRECTSRSIRPEKPKEWEGAINATVEAGQVEYVHSVRHAAVYRVK